MDFVCFLGSIALRVVKFRTSVGENIVNQFLNRFRFTRNLVFPSTPLLEIPGLVQNVHVSHEALKEKPSCVL